MLVQVILIRIENYSFVKNYGSSISWFLRVAGNVLRLGEGCLTDAQFSHGISMAAFAKPLLPAGRFISRI